MLFNCLDGVFAVRRSGDYFDIAIFLKKPPCETAHDRGIIYYQYFYSGVCLGSPLWSRS